MCKGYCTTKGSGWKWCGKIQYSLILSFQNNSLFRLLLVEYLQSDGSGWLNCSVILWISIFSPLKCWRKVGRETLPKKMKGCWSLESWKMIASTMCLLALKVRGSQVLIALLGQTVARDRRAAMLVCTWHRWKLQRMMMRLMRMVRRRRRKRINMSEAELTTWVTKHQSNWIL